MLLLGCVSEEGTFEEDIMSPTKTSFAPTMFDYLYNLSGNCFELEFPLSVFTNTGMLITFLDQNGVNEFKNTQNSNFFIEGITFPFSVTLDEASSLTIRDNNDFSNLLTTCSVPSFSMILSQGIVSCFDYEYPLQVTSTLDQSNSRAVNNSIDFLDFLTDLNFSQITLDYPVTTDTGITINNQFEHFNALRNNCKVIITPIDENDDCPDLFDFDIEYTKPQVNNTTYTFTLNILDDHTPTKIEWLINDQIIEGETETTLAYDIIKNGVYNACAKLTFSGCTEVVEVCQIPPLFVIDINEFCSPNVELKVEKSSLNPAEYNFKAIYRSIDHDDITYTWTIDNGITLNSTPITETSNELTYTFSKAETNRICVTVNNPSCFSDDDIITDCKIITINDEDL